MIRLELAGPDVATQDAQDPGRLAGGVPVHAQLEDVEDLVGGRVEVLGMEHAELLANRVDHRTARGPDGGDDPGPSSSGPWRPT